MDLLERIDEITANSVTPEEFKQTWGYTIDEYVKDMMNRIHQLEGRYTPTEVKMAKVGRIAAKPAAVPAASGKTGIVVTGLVGQTSAKKSGAILVEPAKGIEGTAIIKVAVSPRLKGNVACRKSKMKGSQGPKGGPKGGPK